MHKSNRNNDTLHLKDMPWTTNTCTCSKDNIRERAIKQRVAKNIQIKKPKKNPKVSQGNQSQLNAFNKYIYEGTTEKWENKPLHSFFSNMKCMFIYIY